MTETTDNYGFILPDFNVVTWHDEVNGNFEKIDSLLKTATGLPSVKGAWTVSTAYVVGDRVLDPVDVTLWEALVSHTSRATGTMDDDRTDHPTYWKSIATGWTGRGEWAYNTLYVVGDVAYDSSEYLFQVAIDQHTSVGAGTMRDDSAHWVTLFDGKPAVTAAVAAQVAAELAETNAETAETNAETAETNAAASAAAAAASAVTAAQNNAYLGQYTFSVSTSYPPSAGEIRLNNATQNLATLVYISKTNALGIDLTHQIPISIGIGSKLLVQDRATIGKYMLYDVIADPVLSGSDFQVGVVIATAGTALTALPVMLGVGGGGGAASVTTDDNPPAAPLRDGQLWFKSSTGAFYVYYDDGNTSQWVQVSASPQIAAQNTRNRGFIDPGFNLANDTTDATNDIVFPTGVVASDVAPYPLMSHDVTIRQLDVVFDTNNTDRRGGRFSSAAISDGWWHCFIISNGTLSKSGFSKNLNPTADDLYPAGYTHYRRVASWFRSSGVLIPARHVEERVIYGTPITVRSTTAGNANQLLSVIAPIGLRTRPILSSQVSMNASSIGNNTLGDGDLAAPNFQFQQTGGVDTVVVDQAYTNLNSEVRFSAAATAGTFSTNTLNSLGYFDSRGRL